MTAVAARSAPHRGDPAAEPRIDRRGGYGPLHLICVPGLVPDGPETFARQLGVLRRAGSSAIVTYPQEVFDLEIVLARIRREVLACAAKGGHPLLLGVSVGGGLCLELLRRAAAAGVPLPIAGLVLVSPFTCIADLAPLLRRILDPILAEADRAGGDPGPHLERGRAFFKQIAGRAGGVAVPAGWRSLLSLLTPSGIASRQERNLLDRIGRTLDGVPTAGAVRRVASLRLLPGIADHRGPLTSAPALLLWGSKERHTLDMDGPGTGLLCRPDLAGRLLPGCQVHWVYGRDGGEVPHAALIRHAGAFNPLLARYLAQTVRRVRQRARARTTETT